MRPFSFINKKLHRKLSLWLTIYIVPILFLAGTWVVVHETDRLEESVVDRGTVAAKAGAQAMGLLLEGGVDSGRISMDAVAHPTYTSFYYDQPTDIPRFHSGVDAFTDSVGVQRLEDTILGSSDDFIYAVASDVNTYIPSTNSKIDHPPTGDRKIDAAKSRGKRKYTDPMHEAAAASLAPILVSPYPHDVYGDCWDVSAPVWVHGVHWGSFRVGLTRARIAAHKAELVTVMVTIFSVTLACLVVIITFLVRSSTRYMERLARAADGVSRGEHLDVPIKPETSDEVGTMAAALNRMRHSLRAAMSRLGA